MCSSHWHQGIPMYQSCTNTLTCSSLQFLRPTTLYLFFTSEELTLLCNLSTKLFCRLCERMRVTFSNKPIAENLLQSVGRKVSRKTLTNSSPRTIPFRTSSLCLQHTLHKMPPTRMLIGLILGERRIRRDEVAGWCLRNHHAHNWYLFGLQIVANHSQPLYGSR